MNIIHSFSLYTKPTSLTISYVFDIANIQVLTI